MLCSVERVKACATAIISNVARIVILQGILLCLFKSAREKDMMAELMRRELHDMGYYCNPQEAADYALCILQYQNSLTTSGSSESPCPA